MVFVDPDREIDDAAATEDPNNYMFDMSDLYGNHPEMMEIDDDDPMDEEDESEKYEESDDIGSGPSGDPPLIYDGGDDIPGLPTREDLVIKSDKQAMENIRRQIDNRKTVLFMPHGVEESNEYSHGKPIYKLHLFGALTDGSKAHVILDSIDVFFDVMVPKRPPSFMKLSAKAQKHVEKDIDSREKRIETFTDFITQMFIENDVTITKIEDIQGYPSHGYHVEKCDYKRIYTNNIQDRRKAIHLVRELNSGAAANASGKTVLGEIKTASDDRSAYYRKVSREYLLPLCDWWKLSEYSYQEGRNHIDPLSQHIFRLDIKNVVPLVNPKDSKEKRSKSLDLKRKHLSKDKLCVLAWDIETYTTRKTGDTLPRGINPEDNLFCLGISVHWKDNPESEVRICLVDKPSHPDKRWITVTCGSMQNIIRAFGIVWNKIAPDTEYTFNGSDYDWPFVMEKARQFGELSWLYNKMSAISRKTVTEEGVWKWNYRQGVKIKITPEETFYSSYFQVPGCVPIDIRVCFKKIYPRSEVSKNSSLKYYLERCNLGGKVDMPIKVMWKGYESGDKEMLRKINHYCTIDAKRCQELMVKKNVINEYREVSAMSFVSFSDSHYYAGGMKVCNLMISRAIQRGVLCSNIPQEAKEKGKYPGAWVFHPEKGLENRRPVTGLDAASLYPSIIMAYNLSPEKIIEDPAEAEYWKKKGLDLHPIKFTYLGKERRAWSVRHNNVESETGLYPSILMELFNERKGVKGMLEPWHKKKEHLELVYGTVKKQKLPESEALSKVLQDSSSEKTEMEKALENIGKEIAAIDDQLSMEAKQLLADKKEFDRRKQNAEECVEYLSELGEKKRKNFAQFLKDTYNTVMFEYNGLDSKQKAIKVFMNTFYGEAGNKRSPFFMLVLAGGVTSQGQVILKTVEKFVRKRGFKLKYGDTDSLYVLCPEHCYKECDDSYKAGETTKEEYWIEMVKITMRIIDNLRDEINAYLEKLTGTKHLKFAYEDVLFPVMFAGKKKYFAIAHVNVPNFSPKEYFIRGIDIKKQGQTGLAKEIGMRIMRQAMSVENTLQMREIVENVLREAVENGKQWGFDHFTQSHTYKPDKKNQTVLRFMARMKAQAYVEQLENTRRVKNGQKPKPAIYVLPEPYERFEAVIVKKNAEFDLQGYKSSNRKGDLMEFASVAKQLNLPIDVAFYMQSYVAGLCARFIGYDKEFQPPVSEAKSDKEIDQYAQKKAKKYLDSIIKSVGQQNQKVVRARGTAYKKAYKNAEAAVKSVLVEKLGSASSILHGDVLSYELFLEESVEEGDGEDAVETSKCVNKLVDRAKEMAKRVTESCAGRAEMLAKNYLIDSKGNDIDSEGKSLNTSKNLYRLFGRMCQPIIRGQKKIVPYRQKMLSALDRKEAAIRTTMAAMMPSVSEIAMKYEIDLSRMVEVYRHKEHLSKPILGSISAGSTPLSDEVVLNITKQDKDLLHKFQKHWHEITAIYLTRYQDQELVEYLKKLKSKRISEFVPPEKKAIKNEIALAMKTLAADFDPIDIGLPY